MTAGDSPVRGHPAEQKQGGTPAAESTPSEGDDSVIVADDRLIVATTVQNGGESGTVAINPPAGEHQEYCSVSGHAEAGMIDTLIVK